MLPYLGTLWPVWLLLGIAAFIGWTTWRAKREGKLENENASLRATHDALAIRNEVDRMVDGLTTREKRERLRG